MSSGMHTYRDRALPVRQSTYYSVTDKYPTNYAGTDEMANYFMAQRIQDKFGVEPATKNDILRSVTGPLGLSYYQTSEFLDNAVKQGYMEKVQIRSKKNKGCEE